MNNRKLLIIFGACITLYILWNRLLRIRFPKNIPFYFNNFEFIFIFFGTFMLISALMLIIKKYTKNPQVSSLEPLSNFVTQSLQEFDIFIKDYFRIWTKLRYLHLVLCRFFLNHLHKTKQIYLIVNGLKFVPPMLLVYDIFYVGKINLFYTSLIILILPLLYKYLYHCLHVYYIYLINKVNNILQFRCEEIIEGKTISFFVAKEPTHFFIQETTLTRMGIHKTLYSFEILLNKVYMNNNPKANHKEIFTLYYNGILSTCSELYEVVYTYTIINNKYSIYINLFVLLMYTFCWIYVIVISHYTFSENFIDFFIKIQNNI